MSSSKNPLCHWDVTTQCSDDVMICFGRKSANVPGQRSENSCSKWGCWSGQSDHPLLHRVKWWSRGIPWYIYPKILPASWMSFVIKVVLFMCTVHRTASLKRFTTYASVVSCKARGAVAWKCNSPLCCRAISLTHCTNGSFNIRKPVIF